MRFRIFTQHNEAFIPVVERTLPRLREYCQQHGYDLHVTKSESWERSIIWDRYKIMAESADDYDYLVHMDADVLITNPSIRIEQIVQLDPLSKVFMAMCLREDYSLHFNDGVGIFKNDPEIIGLMQECFEATGDGIYCGQDHIERLYRDHDPIRSVFRIVPQRIMNSFLYTEYGMPAETVGSWREGDFVLHLPGCSNHRRVEIFDSIT